MITPDEIAAALETNREEFSILFLQAQYNAGVATRERTEFEAVVAGTADKKEAFVKAAQYAERSIFYNELVSLIINRGFDGGKLEKAVAVMSNDAQLLQAITDRERGFTDPSKREFGYRLGRECTGKVMINHQFKGSGVLIEPDRFLTAWHVVREMFEPETSGGGYEPKANTGNQLEVVFGDEQIYNDGEFTRGQPVTVAADTGSKWCVKFSACHTAEYNSDKIPDDLEQFDGYWDYAVIRLSTTVNRRPARILKGAVIPEDEPIHIFQYPQNNPIKVDSDVVYRCRPSRQGIPMIRFLHTVNTLDGSSGAPCFDDNYTLIGIHQGKWGTMKVNDSERVLNRGISIRSITRHLGEVRRTPFISFLDKRDYLPVIGCDGFQELLEDAAATAKGTKSPRVILIKGGKGSGKTFQTRVLQSFLSNEEHLKLVLDSQAIAKMDPVAFTIHICSMAGEGAAGNLKTLDEYASTPAAWLKGELLKRIMDTLEARRCGRTVWLCLTDLNVFDIENPQTSDLLFFLYGQVSGNPWLRIVLDGMRISIPPALVDEELIAEHALDNITLQDIRNFLERFFEEMNIPQPIREKKNSFADVLYDDYTGDLLLDPDGAMSKLSQEASRRLSRFLNALKN